jgi:hypothetical protein
VRELVLTENITVDGVVDAPNGWFFPSGDDDDTTGISDYLNSVQKYVVARTFGDPQWEPTTVLSGPLDEEIA